MDGDRFAGLALAPQQELPPVVTRNAAWPYFSLTISLISTILLIGARRQIERHAPAIDLERGEHGDDVLQANQGAREFQDATRAARWLQEKSGKSAPADDRTT